MKGMALVILLLVNTNVFFAQIPADDPTWQLVFSEDFNALDPNVWNVRHHMDNGYDAVMLNSNATISSGNLVLTCKRENPQYTQCPTNFNYECNRLAFDFSGAWVETTNENFHYGYYEIRAKMDHRPGFFPAIWLINSITNPPHYSEIDICEIIGNQQRTDPLSNSLMVQNHFTSNLHPLFPTLDSGKFYKEIPINDYRQYHTYGLDWQPNKISWYIDNVLVRIAYPTLPFDVSMRLVFDVKVTEPLVQLFYGGGNPYTPDYPAKMYIDYFKFYQLKGNCSSTINNCNYNFSTHINNTKQSYEVGGSGCNNIVPSNQYYVFKGNNFVELKEGFEVPLGSSFLGDANDYCAQKNYSTGNCGFVFNPCDYDFSGYINDVKNFIEISGNSCSATIAPTNNVIMHAVQYIHLKEGFSVPQGSEVEIKTVNCQ